MTDPQPTKTRDGDQPLPTPGRECVQDALIRLIEDRKQLGISRYGSALMTHNGRDAMRDALEEALDLTVYLMQVSMEVADLRATVERRAASTPADAPVFQRPEPISDLAAFLAEHPDADAPMTVVEGKLLIDRPVFAMTSELLRAIADQQNRTEAETARLAAIIEQQTAEHADLKATVERVTAVRDRINALREAAQQDRKDYPASSGNGIYADAYAYAGRLLTEALTVDADAADGPSTQASAAAPPDSDASATAVDALAAVTKAAFQGAEITCSPEGWAWRCNGGQGCDGWVGLGLATEGAAWDEFRRHVTDDHGDAT